MNKKFILIIGILSALLLLGYFVCTKTILYVYANPYTQTSGFSYIAKTLKNVDKILQQTKSSMQFDGYKINYIFQNPYGSGFLKNNPIPNDLDYAVGVDLGTYDYNGKNSAEIAADMIDKVNAFYFYFISNVYSERNIKFYSTESSFSILESNKNTRDLNISDIADNLDNVIKQKKYIKYKEVEHFGKLSEDIIMPYIMNYDEILLQDAKQLKLYTEEIAYSETMPHYMREFTIIPEFYVRIKCDKKIYNLELVPETFLGTRLQLSRRCFGSTVFTQLYSLNFLKNVNWLNDDEKYIETRMLSYRRHLGEIENIKSFNKSPVKMLKRIMQTAEMMKPLLSKDDYNMIDDFVKTNLENKDIQLLNELSNIYTNIYNITISKDLYSKLYNTDKMGKMFNIAENIKNELQNRGNVTQVAITEFDKANEYIKDNVLISGKSYVNNPDYKKYEDANNQVQNVISNQMYSLLYKPELVKSIVDVYTKVYTDAGYHRVMFVWLGKNQIGIIKDDYTKNIDNMDLFIKENGFVDGVDYSLITLEQSKQKNLYSMNFVAWVRYNSTPTEEQAYKKLREILINDKKNFKPKMKLILVK